MTDQEQFEDMLARNGVGVIKRRANETSHGVPCIALEIHHSSEKVQTFSHCYCEFRFAADGSLLEISFGY